MSRRKAGPPGTIPVRRLRGTVRAARSVAVCVPVDGELLLLVRVSKRAVYDAIPRMKKRTAWVAARDVFGQLVIG